MRVEYTGDSCLRVILEEGEHRGQVRDNEQVVFYLQSFNIKFIDVYVELYVERLVFP